MACAAFIFNTTEFVPVALLTDIGQSFDMQSSDVGLMMTVYAWTVMIMSLPAMLATGDMERKGLLLKLFVIFIIGHIISVIAWNYWILLIAQYVYCGSAFPLLGNYRIISDACGNSKNKKTQAIGMLAIGYIPCDYFRLTIRPFSRSIG